MNTDLQPLVSERRSDGVVDRLRSLIFTGAYPPGSRLPNERELSVAVSNSFAFGGLNAVLVVRSC